MWVNTTRINCLLKWITFPSPTVSYRLIHANIPTAARQSASWKTLTPLWNVPAVWDTGRLTVAAPVITKWALLHIWIKLPGERENLNTTQSLSSSLICHTGSVTLTASLCLLSLLVAAWRTWERWRRRRQRRKRKTRRLGICSRKSLAGLRAPSLVCTHPVPVLLWSSSHLPATLPRHLSLCPLLTSQLQSSATRRLCGNHQSTMKAD